MSKPLSPTLGSSFSTKISLFSTKTSTKISRILKWKVGVIIFLWECHLVPGKTQVQVT
jgi:hypothetical protein